MARATPLPDAPLKLVAAAVKYPPALYGLATFLGSVPYYFVLALVGSKVKIPVRILVVAAAVLVLAILFDHWRKRRKVPR